MSSDMDLAWIASVVGDPARVRILLALMDGRARTAKELAFLARIAPPTASGHLAKLLDGRLVAVEPQGRHRYYRLASPLVGQMVETLSIVAAETQPADPRLRRVDERLATARTCYDHLAGRLGVAVADALQANGHVAFGDGSGEVTASGRDFFARLGVLLDDRGGGRVFCKPCLDWTERRHHLAGAVGAAFCSHCLSAGWVRRQRDGRALYVSPEGRAAFAELLGIDARTLTYRTREAAAA
ncbi:MAG TPA: winged helix-turn-helix domain-containing protein [Beijerinckiaceae bacterium]|jgi:DNA-binding transcriptional ArsR family regulator